MPLIFQSVITLAACKTPTAGNDTAKRNRRGSLRIQNHREDHPGSSRQKLIERLENKGGSAQSKKTDAPNRHFPMKPGSEFYFVTTFGFVGGFTVTAVAVKKSLRSVALAAPPSSGVIPKIS